MFYFLNRHHKYALTYKIYPTIHTTYKTLFLSSQCIRLYLAEPLSSFLLQTPQRKPIIISWFKSETFLNGQELPCVVSDDFVAAIASQIHVHIVKNDMGSN